MRKKSVALSSKSSIEILWQTEDSDHKIIVENMLACFEALGCRMSLTIFDKTWVA